MLLFDLGWPLIAFLVGVTIFSGLVHGALGLGFSIVATPIIAIFLDVRSAILLTLVPTVAVNLMTIFTGADLVDSLRRYWPLILFSLFGSLIGTFLLASMDPNPFRLVLALLIAAFLCSSYLGKLPKRMLEPHPWIAMIFFGGLAGLSAGTTNVMVAVLLIYLLSMELPRPTIVPILNSCFLVGKIGQIIVFSQAGMVTSASFVHGLPLAVGTIAALLVGQKLQAKIPASGYRRILEGLLVVLAMVLVIQFFR